MSSLVWVVGLFLLIVSVIDLKFRKIPSIFLTGMLFVVAFVSLYLNPQALSFGVIGFIMAYLFLEGGYFSGIADVKVMTMISLMLSVQYWIILFIILIAIYGLFWKILIVKFNLSNDKEFAFLPVFFFCYSTLAILGGIA